MDYFKLKLTGITGDANKLAEDIVDNYGEDYDAKLGNFKAEAVGGDTVEIIVKEVARGDLKVLREDIYRDFGDEEDEMWVNASEYENGTQWFPVDLDDED